MRRLFLLLLVFSVFSHTYAQVNYINPKGKLLSERVGVPAGFTRIKVEPNSFAQYLRNIPLKPHGTKVHYYDGDIKEEKGIYFGVIDMPIGTADLQQCADVIMHLRADYLYRYNKKDKISFTFTNGFKFTYSKWASGYKASINKNKVSWVAAKFSDTSYASFLKYMDVVYTYCGTQSLSKEMDAVNIDAIMPGDILIKGGAPGHTVLVMDVAINTKGKKVFLIAQGYMPAQEMQMLINPNNPQFSPWYEVNGLPEINTPEWPFNKDQLKRFRE
ncbi:MAG: hypothetical protein EBX41_03340 [Chitinophagia bacterium]|nr:hypothetical protein [Chitinophagia bacterium]